VESSHSDYRRLLDRAVDLPVLLAAFHRTIIFLVEVDHNANFLSSQRKLVPKSRKYVTRIIHHSNALHLPSDLVAIPQPEFSMLVELALNSTRHPDLLNQTALLSTIANVNLPNLLIGILIIGTVFWVLTSY
jgi:hypothetical protein